MTEKSYQFPAREKVLRPSQNVDAVSEAYPSSYIIGIRGSFPPTVRRLGRKNDHSSQFTVEVVEFYLHFPIRLHGVQRYSLHIPLRKS
jgi:hypothetical protein